MKLSTALVLAFLSVCSDANQDVRDLTEKFLGTLIEESPLDFKLYFVNKDYYDDGSIKHIDTITFAHNPNKSSDLRLASLGTKKVGQLVTFAEEEGIELSVLENNRAKNYTKTYGTKEQKESDSPALKIFAGYGGYALGVLEQVFDVLYETKNKATIIFYEFYANKAMKRVTTMTIDTKEVMLKDKKKMSDLMVEESKKLLKKAMKVDVTDKAEFIANQFEERYPKYKWNILVNPQAYTCKSDVMVSLKYDNNVYTILGTA